MEDPTEYIISLSKSQKYDENKLWDFILENDKKIDWKTVYNHYKEFNTSLSWYIQGLLYHSGDGVEGDYIQAIHYYKLAAGKGNSSAMTGLGKMYEYGRGVEQDYIKAIHYYNLAIEKGNSSAMKYLKKFITKHPEVYITYNIEQTRELERFRKAYSELPPPESSI